MRATVRNLLLANAYLTTRIPAERWYQVGSVLDVPVKPFAVLRWIAPVSGDARGSFTNQLRIDLHDNRGSYRLLDEVLGGKYRADGIYAVLSPVLDFTGSDGYIAQTDFLGTSGDDVDVDYKSNFKYSSWQIAGRSF